MSRFDSLWIEKYRPKNIDDIVLSDNNKSILQQYVSNQDIPQLIFIGSAGIGKTSLAKIITHDILKCQYLYINASDENGIDTIRSKVTNFSKTKSYDGTNKVIVLDEVDGLTIDAQRCLRNTMEEYSDYTRFILTANYKHKVIPALLSRCQSLDLTPPLDLYLHRCFNVLQSENCDNIDECKEHIEKMCQSCYPDLRQAINQLQKHTLSGKYVVIDNAECDNLVKTIYKLVRNNKTLKMRKYIIENETTFNGDYVQLLRDLFDHVHSHSTINDDMKKKHMLLIAEHIYRSAFVADQEINLYSCLLSLS